MNPTHVIQFTQAAVLPLVADAAAFAFGIITIAILVVVCIRAFGALSR